jgi:hypothetical protein
MHDNS